MLNNSSISMKTKFKVLKTYMWSIFLYGCESWTLTKDVEKIRSHRNAVLEKNFKAFLGWIKNGRVCIMEG